jgi:hypothetical protein
MLSIQSFPYVALFRRGDQQSLFMSQWVFREIFLVLEVKGWMLMVLIESD